MPFSEYNLTINVTVDDVKMAFTGLGANADVFADESIQQKIDEESLIVSAKLPDDLNDLCIPESMWEEAIEMLVRRRAARGTFTASPTVVSKQALDARVSYDVQAFRGRLRDSVEEAEEMMCLHTGGSSAGIAEATGSAFRQRDKTHKGR